MPLTAQHGDLVPGVTIRQISTSRVEISDDRDGQLPGCVAYVRNLVLIAAHLGDVELQGCDLLARGVIRTTAASLVGTCASREQKRQDGTANEGLATEISEAR
ncbi:hypothetical protein [Embleya sp. NPDC050493]|uniref:hypothetical protein n=1 Tax=Embleya sp. NPDC050493 TaxID=3363989 RepID=UPI0037A45D68